MKRATFYVAASMAEKTCWSYVEKGFIKATVCVDMQGCIMYLGSDRFNNLRKVFSSENELEAFLRRFPSMLSIEEAYNLGFKEW